MTAIIKLDPHTESLPPEKIELLKRTVCLGAGNDELQLFLHVCKSTGLDPFLRQIYSIKRGNQRTIQVAIDGLRLIAERTGRYSPGKEPFYKYDDKGKLLSATSYIKKMTPDGTWHEVSSTAIFEEYNPGINNFWKKMGHVMLAKCAEANALRKSFPQEMAGLYVKEEMDQALQDGALPGNDIIVEPMDQEFIDFKVNQFCADYPKDDHEMIKKFLEKYANHYSKSLLEAVKEQDKTKFPDTFEKWKIRELAKLKE